MIAFVRSFKRRRILAALSPDQGGWRRLMGRVALFAGLTDAECLRLRQFAELFLHEKNLDLVGGVRLDEEQRLLLAALACLPILSLGMDAYDHWETLIVYPGKFTPGRSEVDEAGVVHPSQSRVGEAWPNGPVIVSWRDVERDLAGDWDYPMNVVIHEMCHQLDGRHGGFDGMPVLPSGLDPRDWIREFTAAFTALRQAVKHRHESFIDPYAGESPAEFFAVACESFFVAPECLAEGYPGVYALLTLYFRQDPLARLGRGSSKS
ncbi:MAG: zinc-dependent peptidase [Magnetococcales bacterium]|nr:zinc-dependent peptidase [Magnetococcales bacterium]